MSSATRNPYKRQNSISDSIPVHVGLKTSNGEQPRCRPSPKKQRRWTFAGGEDASIAVEQVHMSSRLAPKTALTLLHTARALTRSDPLFLIRQRQRIHNTAKQQPVLAQSLDWLYLHAGMIHELSGPAGTGKTQIALTLCLQAAAAAAPVSVTSPNRGTEANHNNTRSIRAVYLALGSTRLHHVLERLRAMTQNSDGVGILESVVTKCCLGMEDLIVLVTKTLPHLLEQEPYIRILVLDSVANVIRYDDTRTPAQRASLLFQLTAGLHVLCQQFQISVVVLNQVTADITENTNAANVTTNSNGWKPALGLSWEHCVHSRFQVNRQERPCASDASKATCAFDRCIQLVHSNQYPPSSATFAIDTEGCYLLE